jgi:hypothetical protein
MMGKFIKSIFEKKNHDKLAYVLFVVAMLSVMAPLYTGGYILSYDMVFSPNIQFNLESIQAQGGLYSSLPVTAVLWFFALLLPVDVIQKILLSGIFLFSAYSMYRSLNVESWLARVTASIMYMINPFVYDRLMAGHWRMLLAYSLTPFILRYFYDTFVNPSKRNVIKSLLMWSLLIIINVHHLIIIGVLLLSLSVFMLRTRKQLLHVTLTLMGVLLLNSWWIILSILTKGNNGNFGLDHYYAFNTNSDFNYGIWVNMLSLQGFWHTEWQSIKDILMAWPTLLFLWLSSIFAGLSFMQSYKSNEKKLLYSLLLVSLCSLVFAAGPYPLTSDINEALFRYVPGWSGLRESQKFLSLLALSYSVLSAFGIDYIYKRSKKIAIPLASLSLAGVLLITSCIYWGANGQLTTTRYPESWRQFDELLKIDTTSKAIVLPWELYVTNTFTANLIANPAKVYYGDRVIQSQRMGVIGIEDNEPIQYEAIYDAIGNESVESFISSMKYWDTNMIVVTEPSYDKYGWLIQDSRFEILISDDNIVVARLTFR